MLWILGVGANQDKQLDAIKPLQNDECKANLKQTETNFMKTSELMLSSATIFPLYSGRKMFQVHHESLATTISTNSTINDHRRGLNV